MIEENGAIFNEVQHSRMKWLIALMIISSIAPIAVLFVAIQQLRAEGAVAGIAVGLGVLLIDAAVLWLMIASNLKTIVKLDGLYIRYFPFHRRLIKISLENVEKIEAVTYSPMGEYGGWGIRYVRNGKAYNPTGNRGVKITYVGGKSVLIGSQKPEELLQTVQSVR